MNLKNFYSACALCLFSLGASAQAYFGADFGSTQVDNATGEVTSSLVNAVGGSASATQDSTMSAYKVLVGYTVNDNIQLEAAYFQSSSINLNFAGSSRTGVSYAGSESVKFSGLQYSANLRPSKNTGLNNVYAIVGGHNFTADESITLSAGSVSVASSASKSGFGTLYGLGFDIPMENNVNFRTSVVRYSNVAGV